MYQWILYKDDKIFASGKALTPQLASTEANSVARNFSINSPKIIINKI